MDEEVNYSELYGLETGNGETVTTGETEAPEAPAPDVTGVPAGQGPAGRDEDRGSGGGEEGRRVPPVEGKEEPARKAADPPEGGASGREAGAPRAATPPRRDFREDVDAVIRGLGITDPYTGKAVTTKAEYDAYRQRAYDERREAIKRRSGLTDAELDEFVSSTPAVQRAMADAAAARDMMARQRQAEAKRRIDAEVAKISAMDPGVKTLADLTDKEYSGRLTELVKRGYELADAYLVANYAALQRKSADASRQAAYNAQSGKSGMTATKPNGQGGDTVPVPKDTLEMYRAINPEMTDAEIREDYNRYMKKSVK